MIPHEPTILTAPEAIARRRATRRFDADRSPPVEVLKRILHLATFAPSSYNLQPWRFLVVRSLANRQKLRACAFQPAEGYRGSGRRDRLGLSHAAPLAPRADGRRHARARGDHS